MLKMLGMVMVVGASVLMGISMRGRMAKRKRILLELHGAFAMLKTEIVFLKTPLPMAVRKIADTLSCALFSDFADALSTRDTPEAAMRKAIAAEGGNLNASDRDVLCYAASVLGESDSDTQTRHLEMVMERIGKQHTQSEATLKSGGKLCLSAGALCGILMVILLA